MSTMVKIISLTSILTYALISFADQPARRMIPVQTGMTCTARIYLDYYEVVIKSQEQNTFLVYAESLGVLRIHKWQIYQCVKPKVERAPVDADR